MNSRAHTFRGSFTSLALSSHTCRCNEESYVLGADRLERLFTKYFPVTPSTSGDVARKIDVFAPSAGLMPKRERNFITPRPRGPVPFCPKFVATKPG